MRAGGRASRVLIVAVIAGQWVAGAAQSAHAATPPPRYASPSGIATGTCPKPAPCTIATAINDAPADSTVVIEPGHYGTAAAPLTDTFTDENGAIHVHGTDLAHPPVIYSQTAHYGFEFNNASSLSDVEIHNTGTRAAIFITAGTADHVRAFTSGGEFGACSVFVSLTDSLCVATGDFLPAFDIYEGGDLTTTLRGVTAVSTGMGGAGLVDEAVSASTVTINATNSIFSGRGADISEYATVAGATASVKLTNSNYSTYSSNGSAGIERLTAGAGDISAPPKFVDPANGDYREKASSPTVNAGAKDAAGGTDVVGNPRGLGPAPDMGAYELVQKPSTAGLKATSNAAHAVTMTVNVNPQGLATTVRLIATHGHTTVTSSVVSVGHGRAGKAVRLRLKGLTANTTYRIHAVAHNLGGSTNSRSRTITTTKRRDSR
jgi:hypothetical protein